MLYSLISLVFGTVFGFFYASSFVLQQRSTFLMRGTYERRRMIAFFIFRLILLTIFLQYLLRSSLTDSILTLLCFLITFWLIVITKKANVYEGS